MNALVRSPNEKVTGVLDVADRLPAVARALRSADFQDTALTAIGGDEALSRVDPDGRQHGLLGRLTRGLDRFGQNGEEHRAAAEEVRAGHLLLVVTVSCADEKDRAAANLRAQGVRRLRYWGRWDIETLSE